MQDIRKTKGQLLAELTTVRQQLATLQAAHTTRLHAEEAMRDSEQRYRHLVEHSLGLICMHAMDGTLLAVNPAATQALGYLPEEWRGRNLREFLAPRVRHLLDEYLARIRHQPMASGLMHVVTKTGEERIWLYRNVRYEEPGKVPYVIGHAQDITERVQAEQALKQAQVDLEAHVQERTAALQEAEAKYRTLVEQASDAIIIVQDGQIVYANPACETLSGYTWDEICQRQPRVAEFVVPEDRARVVAYYDRRLRGEAVPECYEAGVVRKDGQRVTVEVKPCIIEYQGHQAIMALLRDITIRKRMEDELLKAKKIESVGVLAGGIAHDFNNILTVILANVSLAKRYADPRGKMFGRLTAAENACRRATDLTHQLLTFSQGGAPIRRTASMTDLMHDSIGFALRGSNIRGDIVLPGDLWPVEMDPGQMNQVLYHIVLNAREAMPHGGVVYVRAENLSGDIAPHPALPQGRWIKITMSDQGRGISAEYLPKIFDPYFTTKVGGSGLGLALAYAIVTKHDGLITVTSEVGVGTTFTLYLPASAYTLMPTSDRPPPSLESQGSILVMDDEEAIREVLIDMLTQLGYQSMGARDGAEAVGMYHKAREAGTPFTAVLLDLTIPGGMGGREALAQLRAMDPQVRAIMSTGYANDPLMANFSVYGFSGVLTKPYTMEGLQEVLQQVIAARED
jgi:PAS domain S-box-containing protein